MVSAPIWFLKSIYFGLCQPFQEEAFLYKLRVRASLWMKTIEIADSFEAPLPSCWTGWGPNTFLGPTIAPLSFRWRLETKVNGQNTCLDLTLIGNKNDYTFGSKMLGIHFPGSEVEAFAFLEPKLKCSLYWKWSRSFSLFSSEVEMFAFQEAKSKSSLFWKQIWSLYFSRSKFDLFAFLKRIRSLHFAGNEGNLFIFSEANSKFLLF